MIKFCTIALISIFLVIIFGCTQVGAFSGGAVYDPIRNIETKPTTVEYIKQVSNTATQIANQITNLMSLSPEAMVVHILGVENDLEALINKINKKEGITRSEKSIETNNSLHKKTSNDEQMNNKKKMLVMLYKTYKDVFHGTKLTDDVDKKVKRVSKLLKENKKISGNKDSKQVTGQLQAEKTVLDLEKEQNLGLLTSVLVAEASKMNQEEAQAAQNAFNTISIGASDPYNPTEQDRTNFKRPEGRGFIRF